MSLVWLTPRMQRIESTIKVTNDKHLINLLNRAWWKEFFSQREYTTSEWLERMRELRIGGRR